MTPSSIDPRDLELLQEIEAGARDFRPREGEATDTPSWLRRVERLRGLRDRGYIRMPEPERYYQQPGYQFAGPCELTAEGFDALEQFGT